MQCRRGLVCAQLLTARVLTQFYGTASSLDTADMFSTADDDLFHRIKSNSNHVLHPYLPSNTDIPYQLRTRFHRMTLINKTKHLNEADFIIRLLYKHSY